MSELHDCKKLAELIYAELTQIDGVGKFLDSMDEAMTEAVLDDITATLELYGHTLMTQQQAEPQRVTMAHMDALHKAIDHVASLQNDRLRFQSACEISGDKHPEYVRGYEAAMDAVCKAQPAPTPTSERVLLDLHRHLFEWTAATPIGEEDNQRGASVYNWRRHFTQYVWNYIQGLKRPAEPQGGAE